MATLKIPRDLDNPFNPLDEIQMTEFEEFGCPPDSSDIVTDLQLQTPNSRALRLFHPDLFQRFVTPPLGLPGLLPIPDPVAHDVLQQHSGLHNQTLNVPGLGTVPVWSFRDQRTGAEGWPAPTIRVREGEVVRSEMSNRSGPHTIHHHGIEPTPANDGVGHLTFDVGGDVLFLYQWQAKEAGTYFYHCHVNTVLHFEMGMYGMLIVDPAVSSAPFNDGGPGLTYVGNVLTPYAAEAIWVADDIERRWHTIAEHGHDRRAGIICGGFQSINDPENPRLHDFAPDVFVVSGLAPVTRSAAGRQNVAGAGATVTRGGRLLVRAVNAGYCNTRWRFPTVLQGQVVAADGRTLGRSSFGSYSRPFTLAGIGHQFMLTTARRFDVLIETAQAPTGTHLVEVDFHHWITDDIFEFGRLSIPITITV
jgi:plastocyanin